jgi:hypothetical protein
MGVIGKQRDQGEEQGGKNPERNSTSKLSGHQWNHGQ